MNAVPFDTLKMAQRLEAVGFAAPQAAGAAEALAEALISVDLATKGDIAGVRSEIAALRAELKNDNAALRAELKNDNAALCAELKNDNAALRAELRNDNAALRAEIKSDSSALRTEVVTAMELLQRDMTIKLGGMLIVAVGLLLAAMRYLPPHP